MRILITGGFGYIGSVLIQRLLEEFRDVLITVVDNLFFNQTQMLHLLKDPRVNFIYADVNDFASYEMALLDSEFVLPLAAIVGLPAGERDAHLTWRTNYDVLRKIFTNKSLLQKVIFPNTNSGYGRGSGNMYCDETTKMDPLSNYARSKLDSETLLMHECETISLRLATVFGLSPRMRTDLLVNSFVYKAVTEKCVVLYEPNFKRNYIHIDDVCSAFIFFIKNFDHYSGEVYNVGIPDVNLSKAELCDEIKKEIPQFRYFVKDDEKDVDQRNYIVSNVKLLSTGFEIKRNLSFGIKELIKGYQVIKNLKNPFVN